MFSLDINTNTNDDIVQHNNMVVANNGAVQNDGLLVPNQMNINFSPIKQSGSDKQSFNLQLKFIDDISQDNSIFNYKQDSISKNNQDNSIESTEKLKLKNRATGVNTGNNGNNGINGNNGNNGNNGINNSNNRGFFGDKQDYKELQKVIEYCSQYKGQEQLDQLIGKDDVSSEGTVGNTQNENGEIEVPYSIYQYSSQQKGQSSLVDNKKFLFDPQTRSQIQQFVQTRPPIEQFSQVQSKVGVDQQQIFKMQTNVQQQPFDSGKHKHKDDDGDNKEQNGGVNKENRNNGRNGSQYLNKIQEINQQIKQNVKKQHNNLDSCQQFFDKKKEESDDKLNKVLQKQQSPKLNKNLKQKVLKQQKDVKQLKIKMKDFREIKEKSKSKPKQTNLNVQKPVQQQIIKKQQSSNLQIVNSQSQNSQFQSKSIEKQRKMSYNDYQQSQQSYQKMNRQKNLCQQSLKENVIEQLFSKRLQVLQDIKNIDQMLSKEKESPKRQSYQKVQNNQKNQANYKNQTNQNINQSNKNNQNNVQMNEKQNMKIVVDNDQKQKKFHVKRETVYYQINNGQTRSALSRNNSSLYSQIHKSRDQVKQNTSQTNKKQNTTQTNKKQKTEKKVQSSSSIKKQKNNKQEMSQNKKLAKEISELMQIFQEIKQVRV